MGRGGYLGGSTIIYPGSDWFSGVHPRGSSRAARSRRRITTNFCSPQALAYLKVVVAAIKTKRPEPKVPDELADEVGRSGGPVEWAKTRREYADLKSPPPSVGTKAKPATEREKSKTPQSLRIPEIRYDYIRSVLIADRKGAVVPNVPKVLRVELAPFAGDNDRIIEWAKGRAEARQVISGLPAVKLSPSLAGDPFEQAKASYLAAVVGAMMRREPHPKPPRKWQLQFESEINDAGGVAVWARKQVAYESLAVRALAKAKQKSAAPSIEHRRNVAKPQTKTHTLAVGKLLQAAEAATLKKSILAELVRTHPGTSTGTIVDAEILAMSMLQEHAMNLFQTDGRPNLQLFPAYVALMGEIKVALRQRRRS